MLAFFVFAILVFVAVAGEGYTDDWGNYMGEVACGDCIGGVCEACGGHGCGVCHDSGLCSTCGGSGSYPDDRGDDPADWGDDDAWECD